MNDRARAFWRRHATLLAAAALHVGLLWLLVLSTIDPPAPLPSDSVDVAIMPPVPPPKPPPPPPKPVRAKPAVRPAVKDSVAARHHVQPVPRLAHIVPPPIHLTLPDPLLPKPPMSLPPAAGPPAIGAGDGSGRNGAGAGDGTQEGNDYLIRLKAYIDRRKGSARHVEPHDAEVVLVLDPDGVLTGIHIAASSGDPSVDDEIMTQLRGMSPFPKPPAILFSPSKQRLPVMDEWIFPRP